MTFDIYHLTADEATKYGTKTSSSSHLTQYFLNPLEKNNFISQHNHQDPDDAEVLCRPRKTIFVCASSLLLALLLGYFTFRNK
jgi:hypothetical protein